MRAKVKTTRRKASKLHGATAGYVSLVDRGANETPFKMVKSAEGAGAMSIKKRKTVAASHKKITSGKKAEAETPKTKTVMAKMVFSQDVFEDESDVREWIEKAEWDAEGISITDDGDGNYVARPEGTTDESFTRMSKVDPESEGVEAYVGEMIVKSEDDDADDDDAEDDAEDDEDDADGDDEDEGDEADKEVKDADKAKETKTEDKPAPAKLSKRAEFIAKAKSTVAKFSGWDAFYSKKSTLAEALKAGMSWDATPPGFYDVQSAFNGVVQSILSDDAEGLNKAEALSKAAADYADILVGMDTFFDAYINAGEETVKKTFDTADTPEKLSKWAEGYAQFVAGVAEAPATVAKESVKKAADPAVAIDHKSIAELVAKAVEPLAAKVDDVAGVVTKLSDRRQTKKSADLADAGTGDAPTKERKAESTEDWLRQKQRKGLIG